LGKAVNYFLNDYAALTGYLKDVRFEIDNNLVENAIRPNRRRPQPGSSLALPTLDGGAPSFTPSSSVAASDASILRITWLMSGAVYLQ